jgi:hypothetical protein
MSSHALSLGPAVRTGGPCFDRDRWNRAVQHHCTELKAISARACPDLPAPSPVREALGVIG